MLMTFLYEKDELGESGSDLLRPGSNLSHNGNRMPKADWYNITVPLSSLIID